jgi:ribosomal protein L34E
VQIERYLLESSGKIQAKTPGKKIVKTTKKTTISRCGGGGYLLMGKSKSQKNQLIFLRKLGWVMWELEPLLESGGLI